MPADTPRQCVQRLITTRAYENAQNAVAATNLGPSTVASPLRSAVKDFLSAASAQIEGSSVKDSGTALILDYNLLKRINLEATFPDPAASPAAASTGTVEQLSRGDDVLTTLSYNVVTRYFGRNVDRALFDSILAALISNAAPATAAVPGTSYDTPFLQLFPDAAARVTALAEYESAAIAALPAVATQLGSDLAQLANRQPQLFASGLYHHRAAAVGPDEHGFRLTWEIGMDNLNTFRREEGRGCEARGDCLASFSDFTARTSKRHRTGRLSLAVQYGKTALNNGGTFTEVATNGFTYLATYGQEISSFTGQPARFDLAYTYDGKKTTRGFTTGGAASSRVTTFVAQDGTVIPPSSIHDAIAFTITQPVARNLSVPVSVVRLKHDEWIPGSRCDLNGPINVPISFPLPTPVPCTPPTHRLFSKTEVVLAVHYQVPPFPRPAQNPACCCK